MHIAKVPSTPHDPSEAILGAIGEIVSQHACDGRISFFGHGTTVATNALIEGKGAETGLVTTAGFRDLLEIGRQRRPHLYDLQRDKPTPLVRRDRRLELDERVYYDGRAERRPRLEQIDALAADLREMGVESIAICFLYSFVDPAHERMVRDRLHELLPDVFVTASHEISPEFREYERLSTTVVNSFVGPMMHRYLRRLEDGLRAAQIAGSPHITLSNGGVVSFETAMRQPMRTILSGPSTGLVGASRVAQRSGFDDLITFDMGGTSTDVALIKQGVPTMRSDLEVQGYAIRAPMLDIETIGAGGGSIAWVDSGGHLRVGPESAGASPGPAGYGHGGTAATVTDANIVLGILGEGRVLAGRLPLDVSAAEKVVGDLAIQLGLGLYETAAGILRVVTANMARAIRVISAAKGHDPRDYTMVAFGGAGPLHAARLAHEMDIPRVLIPDSPGVLCAMGLLVANLRTDYARTQILTAVDENLAAIAATFEELEAEATAWFEAEHIEIEQRRTVTVADMRYRGQNYELRVSLPRPLVDREALEELVRRFAAVHEQAYGYRLDAEVVQIVTARIEATGIRVEPPVEPDELGDGDPGRALLEARELRFVGLDGQRCSVYDRAQLRAGDVIQGPAVIEQMDTTTFVPPGARLTVDRYRSLIMEFEA
jgi:N-methylhydantoinase A